MFHDGIAFDGEKAEDGFSMDLIVKVPVDCVQHQQGEID